MTMGPSTVAIGLLPSYNTIGILAPILLAVFRFGQGLGLGGEWGGAVLLATENAPENKKAWYGMFPQLGAPIGFILSSGTFFILTETMSDDQFVAYGWRIPFIVFTSLILNLVLIFYIPVLFPDSHIKAIHHAPQQPEVLRPDLPEG